MDCFEEMRCKGILPDVVSWNVLIVGYARNNHAQQTLNYFEEMLLESILLDVMTCAWVLNVCGHRGLTEKGQALL